MHNSGTEWFQNIMEMKEKEHIHGRYSIFTTKRLGKFDRSLDLMEAAVVLLSESSIFIRAMLSMTHYCSTE